MLICDVECEDESNLRSKKGGLFTEKGFEKEGFAR